MSSRIGFTQVEPNHLSGIVTGHILAQLPVDQTTMGKVIEQGRFAKYNLAAGKVDLAGAGEWMMIYNEEKLYDERKQQHKDFAMVASNYVDGVITPRLITVEVGDIFTTNAIHVDNTGADKAMTVAEINAITDSTEVEITLPVVTTVLYIGSDGYLCTTKPLSCDGPEFQVVKPANFTLPDGQAAVKVMRIK